MKKPMFIHEVKLNGEDDFSKRFNYVSELFGKYQNAQTEEEKKNAFEAYTQSKYCLEQGLPLPI